MDYPRLIDNMRVSLGDTLLKIAPDFSELSIATGYWDLLGTAELIDSIKDYKFIRLLIGQEPMSLRYQKKLSLDFSKPDSLFPEEDIKADLIDSYSKHAELHKLKDTVTKLCNLINSKRLEIRVYKKSTLHAKAYIFGNYSSNSSKAILGSSNFTKAGLFQNTELNSFESDYRVVNFKPVSEDQENGYLSWFDTLWNDEECVDWTGNFRDTIQHSPVGNLTYGPYDAYIRALMEVYPEEIIPPQVLNKDTADILFSFQNRNAGILINKLNNNGIAILADSVGLGKTITAGAVIKFYMEQNPKWNTLIIAPAALKPQWKEDLANVLDIFEVNGDYQIVSQQDSNAIDKIRTDYELAKRRSRNLDLIVIDEAHNLRSNSGRHHDSVLELLQQHPDAKVLLLTATPINNSLIDLANIIQLASRGRLSSVSVSYPRPDGQIDVIDFFDALKKIQTGIKKASNNKGDIEEFLIPYKPTIHEGLRHYLVRSTRQGVEAEGGIVDKTTGQKRAFPKTNISALIYAYPDNIASEIFESIGDNIDTLFEGIDPRTISLERLASRTQVTSHPLVFLKDSDSTIYFSESKKNLIQNILQVVFMMGFTPYRPFMYQHKYWNKSIQDIRELIVPEKIKIQLAVHNIMHITWLKRLESSTSALLYSIKNYEQRLYLFEKYLNKGYIVNISDTNLLESDYNNGEDIELAFSDYEDYLKKKEEAIENGENADELKKQGIERIIADPQIYNIEEMKKDIEKENKIIKFLYSNIKKIVAPENNPKIKVLHDEIKKIINSGKHGKKVLVFSFFADTIKYLQQYGASIFKDIDKDFDKHSGFIYGQGNESENIAKRFSPKSKHYTLKDAEHEINFLFSTDVLSEGQNLQDAGYLINYDLHWNPVRMIQRNGRINRLGSPYEEVQISNMRPTDDLDLYLGLVNKLERKINTIKNTVGLDQGVLYTSEVNPIQFIEKYYTDGELPSDEDESLLSSSDKHMMELRKFLAENPEGSEVYERIIGIPAGKWNYLPKDSTFNKEALSLVKVYGKSSEEENLSEGVFFIDTSKGNIATYINSIQALDYIKTVPTDNEPSVDKIDLDKAKLVKRVKAAAKMQYENPTNTYNIKPQAEQALNIITPYLSDISYREDFFGNIRLGVVTSDLQKDFEAIVRKIIKEQKQQQSLSQSTIVEFAKVYERIKENVVETKIAVEMSEVINYAINDNNV